MFKKYVSQLSTIEAYQWDGKDVPEELARDERVMVVMVQGQKCIEVFYGGDYQRAQPKDYLVKERDWFYVIPHFKFVHKWLPSSTDDDTFVNLPFLVGGLRNALLNDVVRKALQDEGWSTRDNDALLSNLNDLIRTIVKR